MPRNLSILTLPYKVEYGVAFGIDLFVESENDFKTHMQVKFQS